MSERATEPSPVSPPQGDRPQPAVPPPPPTHPPMPGRENGANGSSGDTAARGVPSANGKPDSKPDAKPDAGDTQGAGIPPAPKQPPPSAPPPSAPPPTHPAPARPPGDQDRGNPTPAKPNPPVKPAPTPEPQSKTDTAAVPRVPAAGAAGTAAGGTSTTTSITDKPAPAPRGRAPRRARLRMTRIDPWSVMKTAFLLSIAFAVVTVVAVAMVWQVLGAAGVWESINSTIQESIGGDDVASFQVQDYLGTSRVLGFTMLVAAIDVILLTAAATLTAFLYNMAAALLGGVEVTLAEDQD